MRVGLIAFAAAAGALSAACGGPRAFMSALRATMGATAALTFVLAIIALPASATALPTNIGPLSTTIDAASAPGGKITVVGSTQPCTSSTTSCDVLMPLIARVYEGTGRLDTGFGSGGGAIVEAPPAGQRAIADRVGSQPDGSSIVLIRRAENGALVAAGLQRFDVDGNRDMNFGGEGEAILGADAVDLIVQPDGKSVVLENEDGEIVLRRFLTTGSPDLDFGVDGVANVAHSSSGLYGLDAERDSQGRYVVYAEDESSSSVIRVKSGGDLDSSFGDGDGVAPALSATDEDFAAGGLAIAPGDRIVVGASESDFNAHGCHTRRLMRLTVDGIPDPSFGNDGEESSSLFGCSGLSAISILGTRMFTLGEQYNLATSIVQTVLIASRPSGSRNPKFGADGAVTTPPPAADVYPATVIAEPDGGAVVAGTADSSGDDCVGGDPVLVGDPCSALMLAHYDRRGKLDPGFGSRGISLVPRFSSCRFRDGRGRLSLPTSGHLAKVRLAYRSYRSVGVTAYLKATPDRPRTRLVSFLTKKGDGLSVLKRTRRLKGPDLKALQTSPGQARISLASPGDRSYCRQGFTLTGHGKKPFRSLSFR